MNLSVVLQQAINIPQGQGEVLCVSSQTFGAYEKLQVKLRDVQKECEVLMNNPQVRFYLL